MRAPNLFRVSAEVIVAIDAWLASRKLMTAEEIDLDRPPAEFDRNFVNSAQAAVAQLCAEKPFVVIGGVLAICVIPVLMLLGWAFRL